MTEETKTHSVGKKAANAASWMVVARVLNQTIRSTRLIVLAAIISPEQLGLFGLAMVAMMLIQQLGETGIRRALIQRDGNIREFLATAQTVQIARGLLLASTIFFLSPQAETFFEKEGLAQLLMVLAVVPFIGGFKNIGEVYLYRELRMKKVVALQLILTIVEFATALIFCLLSPVAISLIYAQIVSALIGLAGSYVIEKRRTFWGFSRQRFLHLYSFGFWVFISAVISFLLVRGGDLVIGKLLPAADLAVYQIAYGVACMPIIEISRVLSTTTFSAFSRLQSEPERLREAFLKVFFITCCIGSLGVCGFLLFGHLFANLFLKPDFQMVGFLLPWIAVWGACRALGAASSVLFQAIGKPAYATVFQFFMLILFAAVVIPSANTWGMHGVVYSLVGIGVTAQVARTLFLLRFVAVSIAQILLRAGVSIGCGCTAAGLTYLLLTLLPNDRGLLIFTSGTITLVCMYAAATIYADRYFQFGIGNYLSSNIPFLKRLRLGHNS